MDRGYLKLWRKFQDHPFWKEKREFSKAEAWIDLLWEAQHKDEPQEVIIKMKVLTCNKGESLKSMETWARRWNWSKSKVKRFFDLLCELNQVVLKSETVTTRLTILNYSDYNEKQNRNETQVKRNRNASETQSNPDKNVNNEKNEKNDKENIFLSDSIEYRLSEFLVEKIKENNPQFKKPNLQVWSKHIEEMLRIDKRTPEDIQIIIEFCQSDNFWKTNILSTKKLREKFDQLWIKMGNGKKSSFLSEKGQQTWNNIKDVNFSELTKNAR